MTINSYLTSLASGAISRNQEKLSIQRSIANLESRLKDHFGAQRADSLIFGSYSRGTILPRYMDENSDVDYMVVFSDSGLRPQSYLDRLRRFAEINYQRSDIEQSNPTIVLSLNHIRFELVPATKNWGSLQIPARSSDYNDWIYTDPTDFNDTLVKANQANGNQIKPLVRLMKYWNASSGYPFESYSLEQKVAKKNYGFGFLGLQTSRRLDDYFFQFVRELDLGWSEPQWKKDAVSRLRQLTEQAQKYENDGSVAQAEATIQRILPLS
jgi:predicted nucleotidyltransferase